MTKISVIIPVYNAATHLNQCITSLINQTHKEIEFIFVNDGSIDNSKNIIEDFQKNDSRIKVIHQENKGVSVARNTGLALATGDYIGFVDADDFIELNYFEKLGNEIKYYNSDIVISNFSTQIKNKFIINNSKFSKNNPYHKLEIHQEILPEFIKSSLLNSVCNKLYKASCIKYIFFPIGIALGEDGIFNMQAFKNAESVVFIDYSGYFYKEVEGSATKNVKGKDYFQRALDGYHFDFSNYFDFPKEDIIKWKSVRLIENVCSLIHIYFASNNGLSTISKFKKVNQIVHHKIVQQTVKQFHAEIQSGKSNYLKFFIKAIKLKNVFLLYFLVKYSQSRNI
jgi:glycosyltransferase involved in cell wall biosynthesis